MATESYLPVGTKLCISSAAVKPRWYVTKKEIVLGSETAVATCPLTGWGVRTTKADGFDVFFQPRQVNNRRVPDGPDARNLNACLLIYDIPGTAEVGNPSAVLRRLGVRVNLSCWIVPESDIPYVTLHRMQEAGATWHTVRFDASEAKKLIDMAVSALRKELDEALARAEASRASAAEQLEQSTAAPERAEAYYLRRAESIAARCAELADDLAAGAAKFGIDSAQFNADALRTAGAAIQAGMQERAKLYARAVRDAARLGTPFPESTPAGVIADALQDGGSDEQADELRAAFAGVPGSFVGE